MGMFDNLQCDIPLPNEARTVREWQTKDLDCSMTHYAIRSDGRLVNAQIRMERKPGAPDEPELHAPEYLTWYREWFERKEGPDVDVPFTGGLTFYGYDAHHQWWEFCAFIESGKCIKIIAIEPAPPERR